MSKKNKKNAQQTVANNGNKTTTVAQPAPAVNTQSK
jgi:hypothetical protein